MRAVLQCERSRDKKQRRARRGRSLRRLHVAELPQQIAANFRGHDFMAIITRVVRVRTNLDGTTRKRQESWPVRWGGVPTAMLGKRNVAGNQRSFARRELIGPWVFFAPQSIDRPGTDRRQKD